MFKSIIAASAIAASLSMPLAMAAEPLSIVDKGDSDAKVILVYGGCGVYSHRGPYGGCRPGGQFGGYVRGVSCPAGFHIGPYGRHCWPNRF